MTTIPAPGAHAPGRPRTEAATATAHRPVAAQRMGTPEGTPDRLRVRIGADQRIYDGPRARLGRLEFHLTDDGWYLVNRGVRGGLFLKGCRVQQLPLFSGEPVTLHARTPNGPKIELDLVKARARPVDTIAKPPALVVRRATVTSEKGDVLLRPVSFELQPATLTAVIGPSGAGKSTLLSALAGQGGVASGRVIFKGTHLSSDDPSLRTLVGFVPQADIQHPQLQVGAGLEFSARLRLPSGTSDSAIRRRVDDVLGQVGLKAQRDHRIGSQLSGGQRKRVSIATELLTAPPLLFLDEPTSGLDPGMDRALMHQLRNLADRDRVVLVATHSLLGLDLCDNVVAVARGGRVVYVGPPDRLLEHFGCRDYPELFELLDADTPVPESVPQVRVVPSGGRRVSSPRPSSWSDQLATLIRRNVAVLRSDRLLMSMLFLTPLVLAVLGHLVQGDAGLSLLDTKSGKNMYATEANQRLTILVVAAALMGCAMTVRELVGERAIFRREHAVGLSASAYYASKAIVFGTACFLQGALVAWLALLGMPGPDGGGVHGWGRLEIVLVMGLLSTVMALMGLWISALVRTLEQTTPALVAVVMSQVVFSAALVNFAGRGLLEYLTWLAPSRWAYAAAAGSIDIERAKRRAGFEFDQLFEADGGRWVTNVVVLALLGVMFAWLGMRALDRRAS